MIRLSSIIKTFGSSFREEFRDEILPSHRQALSAMESCRTRQNLKMLLGCTECGQKIYVPHSCGHRNCPHCQNHESQQWLERQLKKQVRAEYFLVTFTLPAEFRPLAWRHQRRIYSRMIQCCWDILKTFSRNDKELQGTPGAIAVLHTHARALDYHPHVHLVVPAAAIDRIARLWRTKKPKRTGTSGKTRPYLFNHKALAKVFRAKMLEAIGQEGLALPARHPKKWIVNCKSVGSGEKALVYLGRYLYRGVIREKDIVSCEDGCVTFRYQNSTTKRMEYKTVTGAEFLWLVLQHVLPKGFRRARNFGFLHPNSKQLIQVLQLRFQLDPNQAMAWIKKRAPVLCRCCGAAMVIIETRIPPVFRGTATVPT